MLTSLRRSEFSRLDRDGLAYLDYTGAALYAERQLRRHHERLATTVLGNPHSESDPSQLSTRIIDEARSRVLRHFDADPGQYTVIFTANCSAAVKLVAESYPFGRYGALVLTADNHNSVNGLREYARRARTTVEYIGLDEEMRLSDAERAFGAWRRRGSRLFAFPAQSNFSGVQHPLALIERAHHAGFDVLLDAASFAGSNALSLRDYSPEFVALSFYKMFGYPTGVGALIARRDALSRLQRPWFAGGTVDYASVQNGLHALKPDAEGFEDGTPNFIGISALAAGFELLDEVGMPRIHEHVVRLTTALLSGLRSVSQANGRRVAIYGPTEVWMRGGTVAFNVLESDGRAIPYALVERKAREAGIAVRGGCFCNPGAAEYAFGFDAQRARHCLQARDRFTVERFADCLGDSTAVGAVRASVGLANTIEDVDRVIDLVHRLCGGRVRAVS